jgi:hypothetical protein
LPEVHLKPQSPSREQAFTPDRFFTELILARSAGCGLLNIVHLSLALIEIQQAPEDRWRAVQIALL